MKNLRTVLLLVLCLGGLAPIGGCSCWKDPLAKVGSEKKKPETLEEMEARRKELQEKQEEKPDFETIRLTVLPADDAPTRNQVKPGHWFNAVQTMKANNFDFSKGDLDAQCVDTAGQPIPLPGTNFDLRTTRPVSLPKGQQKHFDLLLFANMPRQGKGSINFITKLRPRGGGREVDWKHEATTRMKPFQNHMVVLAERADNYQFIKALRSVKPERSTDEFLSAELDYFVKLPKGTRRVDLPTHPLAWSNMAYVLWDDFDPEILNSSQQQAMIDWLHWGGQLIINGPRTLDRLAGSFIAPYLPARTGEVSALSDEQINTLNAYWSFDEEDARPLALTKEEDRPVTIELDIAQQARLVPNTADLIADLHVGRGRVVTTAFNIPHEVFLSWDSFDCFFNACLLDRPARRFYVQPGGNIIERWAPSGLTREDPRVTSKMRYFSRDAMALSTRTRRSRERADQEAVRRAQAFSDARNRGVPRSTLRQLEADIPTEAESDPIATALHLEQNMQDAFAVDGFSKDDLIGVAGWSDQSDVSQAARDALQKSAGISVPSIEFIAKVLGVYLLVLVPLNWLIFRLMGRVEWAWAAVPLIAIGGALGVVQAAQLDIGFARSRTEIALVEIQPNYERAHLTRYIGFYSSLSSSYEIGGEDESTLFQPLASSQRVGDRRVALYQGDGVSLSGFNVLSNSTGLVHGEQMLKLGGKLTFSDDEGKAVVNNQTNFDLRGTAIIRRGRDDIVEAAWVGDLESKAQTGNLDFTPHETQNVEFAEWESLPATSRKSAEGDLNIRRLIEIATDKRRLGRGEAVLVGWNDQIVEGVQVSPRASQTTARTLFVAQLQHAERPDPKRDVNSFAVFDREKKQREKENRDDGDFDF